MRIPYVIDNQTSRLADIPCRVQRGQVAGELILQLEGTTAERCG